MSTTNKEPKRPVRRWRRTVQFMLLVSVASGLTVLSNPGTAAADDSYPCPTLPLTNAASGVGGTGGIGRPMLVRDPKGVRQERTPDGIFIRIERWYQITPISATPEFIVSDGRVVDNQTNEVIQATFTSQQTRQISITASFGLDFQVTEKLKTNVSSQIVQSRTTAIGINAAVAVQPHTRMIGEYGLQAFAATYDIYVFDSWNRYRCFDRGTWRESTHAPTVLEGWRFTVA